MRKSILLAILMALGAAGWIASGQLGDNDGAATANSEKAAPAAEPALPTVRVRRIEPTMKQRSIVVNGRAEASRRVDIRAETLGRIASVGAAQGAKLNKGDIIARIATEDRRARLAEARAVLRQREMEYKAAKQLSKKGFRSGTKLAESQAYRDSARAQLRRMEIEINHTVIRAPFAGILENRSIEIGAYLKQGDPVATVVDLDPALIVAYVSERDVGKVKPGLKGSAKLVDGRTVEGTLKFVGTVADAATRSFRVELEVPNTQRAVRDGVTAELTIPLRPIRAYLISPAILSLSDDGRIGVKIVEAGDIVKFVPVKIHADTSEGVWIGGIPEGARLITVGHEFVKSGRKVVPVTAKAGAGS